MTEMNPEVASLTTEQQAVLRAIYDYFHEHAAWPTFITIDRPIRREHRWDTAAIVLSLPESMIVPPRPGKLRPIERDELRLHLLGIEACRGGTEDTARLVRLLRWMAEREMAHEPGTDGEDTMPRVTSVEVRQYLGLGDADEIALQRLYVMLQLDNWGLSGASGSSPDGWYVTLGQDIWRFRDVQSVQDCIEAHEAWRAEGRQAPAWINTEPALFQGGMAPVAPLPFYVDEQVVGAIRAKDGQSRFDVTKLLDLIAELNDNYASRNTYASHALLRAILDHVPPIFGYTGFREVANNYSWGQTDRKYIKRLADFRDQADDALHRQIGRNADLLDFEDMPASVYVDRLLQECAECL
jgi:hypothetical protein